MTNRILIDSSFLYAVYNAGDRNHQVAIDFLAIPTNTLIVPEITLPEVAFLFARDFGYYAIEIFLGEFASAGQQMVSLTLADIQRAQQIMKAYPTAKLDLVDTCIMALSERLQITKVCTFDRRDFNIFRPKHCDFLELLP